MPLYLGIINDDKVNLNDKGVTLQVEPINVKEQWLTKKADDLKLNLSSEKDIKVIGNKFSSNLNGNGAIGLNKVDAGWEAVFNVWDIIRYVDFRDSVNIIELSGQFIDDTPFITTGDIMPLAKEEDIKSISRIGV